MTVSLSSAILIAALLIAVRPSHARRLQEIADECERRQPCAKNEQCVDLTAGFKCVRPAAGNCSGDCEERPSCRDKPCHAENSEKCEEGEERGRECVCKPGFTGDSCDEVDECASSPCQNNGTCEDLLNGFRCHCRPGFIGLDCSALASCQLPCQHGGRCYRPNSLSPCACPIGSSGRRCETLSAVGLGDGRPLQLRGVRRALAWRMTLPLAVDAPVLLATGETFSAIVFLQWRRLHLRVSHGSVEEGVIGAEVGNQTAPGSGLSEGSYRFSVNTSEVSVTYPCVDDECRLLWTSTSNLSLPVDLAVSLGGSNTLHALLRSLFHAGGSLRLRACLSDLWVDGEAVNLSSLVTNDTGACPSSPPICSPGLCGRHGRCVALWTAVECRCDDGFSGDHCQHWTAAQFSSGQFLHVQWPGKIRSVSLQVASKESSPRQPILYMLGSANSTSFLLSLLNGFVEMSVRSDNSVSTLRSSNHFYSDGVGRVISVIFDNDTVTSSVTNASLTLSHLHVGHHLFLGSLHHHADLDSSLFPVSSFVGRLGALTVSGQPVDLHDASASPLGRDPPPPRSGPSPVPDYTFSGHSYARLSLDLSTRRLRTSFRSRLRSATIFFLVFQVGDLEWRLEEGRATVRTTGGALHSFSPASDGRWHEVSVSWSTSRPIINLSFDGQDVSLAFPHDARSPIVFVGAKPSIPGDPLSPMIDHFKGCLRRLLLDESLFLPLVRSQNGSGRVFAENVCQGCDDDFDLSCRSIPSPNTCNSVSPCLHNGSCVGLDGGATSCFCPHDFFGPVCEHPKLAVSTHNTEKKKRRASSIPLFFVVVAVFVVMSSFGTFFTWARNHGENHEKKMAWLDLRWHIGGGYWKHHNYKKRSNRHFSMVEEK